MCALLRPVMFSSLCILLFCTWNLCRCRPFYISTLFHCTNPWLCLCVSLSSVLLHNLCYILQLPGFHTCASLFNVFPLFKCVCHLLSWCVPPFEVWPIIISVLLHNILYVFVTILSLGKRNLAIGQIKGSCSTSLHRFHKELCKSRYTGGSLLGFKITSTQDGPAKLMA